MDKTKKSKGVRFDEKTLQEIARYVVAAKAAIGYDLDFSEVVRVAVRKGLVVMQQELK